MIAKPKGKGPLLESGTLSPNPWDLSLSRQNGCSTLKALERRIGLRRDATRAPIQGPEWQGAASPAVPNSNPRRRRALAYCGQKMVLTTGSTLGNRRTAALRWLVELHQSGRETFNAEQFKNLTELQVLLLDDEIAPDSARWILPGLRHVSGIKEWGPYQKERAVFALRESGMSPQEAAQSLGLSTRAANQLWRSYLALEQMRADEEYGEHAEPTLYSFFEEVFKRPNVRDWLQWNDADRGFTNAPRLREFYGWVIGEPAEAGELGEPKLSEAKAIRDLGTIIDDAGAIAVFRSPGGTLTRALARFEVEHPQEWTTAVTNAEAVLAALSPDVLRKLAEPDVELLNGLRERVVRVLDDRQLLIQN